MLARGLRRGSRRSWFLAVTILAVTIVAHAVRGGTIVSLLIAVGILVLLVGQRRYFQATSDRSSAADALPRLGFVALVAVFTASIGIEATAPHQLPSFGVVVVACIERLVGQYDITLPDRVEDFISPALLAIGLTLIVSALYLITRPVVDRRLSSRLVRVNDDSRSCGRARSSDATVVEHLTTLPFAMTSSFSSFATRWSPTRSTVASPWSRPTRLDLRPNVAKSSAPFASSPKHTGGPLG